MPGGVLPGASGGGVGGPCHLARGGAEGGADPAAVGCPLAAGSAAGAAGVLSLRSRRSLHSQLFVVGTGSRRRGGWLRLSRIGLSRIGRLVFFDRTGSACRRAVAAL